LPSTDPTIITDKDVFECYYKNLFAKRLLSGRSVSDELEKSMIGKLKAECGYIYVAKLESMYTDKHLSKDILANFRSSEHYKALGKIELDVMTLTSSNWPIVSKTR
jgi:cullin 3